jgi:hypothetical protein
MRIVVLVGDNNVYWMKKNPNCEVVMMMMVKMILEKVGES